MGWIRLRISLLIWTSFVCGLLPREWWSVAITILCIVAQVAFLQISIERYREAK